MAFHHCTLDKICTDAEFSDISRQTIETIRRRAGSARGGRKIHLDRLPPACDLRKIVARTDGVAQPKQTFCRLSPKLRYRIHTVALDLWDPPSTALQHNCQRIVVVALAFAMAALMGHAGL